MSNRIHCFGASGAGTTTLALALAKKLKVPHIDADTVGWKKTEPPFIERNEIEERIRLLKAQTDRAEAWVLSGSLWSLDIMQLFPFTLVVFLYLDTADRIARLEVREHERYGEKVQPGGDRYQHSQDFLKWARMYDTGHARMRSRALHEQWIDRMTFPLLRLKTLAHPTDLVKQVLEFSAAVERKEEKC